MGDLMDDKGEGKKGAGEIKIKMRKRRENIATIG